MSNNDDNILRPTAREALRRSGAWGLFLGAVGMALVGLTAFAILASESKIDLATGIMFGTEGLAIAFALAALTELRIHQVQMTLMSIDRALAELRARR